MTTLAKMPLPEVYEKEYLYWPWEKTVERVCQYFKEKVSHKKLVPVFDYMCGTGHVLNLINFVNPGLILKGCDISSDYIEYGKQRYRSTEYWNIEVGDALTYEQKYKPDYILLTGGLHHLEHNDQPRMLEKIAGELAPGGRFIFADEFIAPYTNESERKINVLELGAAIAKYMINEHDAPKEMINTALQVMHNDLFEEGEYKISLELAIDMLKKFFICESISRVWPLPVASVLQHARVYQPHGDYLIVCRKKNR